MKKLLIWVLFIFITTSIVHWTPGRLNSEGCHNSSSIWYHCHDENWEVIETTEEKEIIEDKVEKKASDYTSNKKLQKKIDLINGKIEIIYKKKPKTIEKLKKQIDKILPKLKEWSTKYILILAISDKIDFLTAEEDIKIDDKVHSNWNTFSDSFSKSKKYLEKSVYNSEELERNTFYCSCDYSSDKYVDKESCWFQDNWKYVSRSKKIEWEHVVPAEAFGQSFKEWRDWHESCIDSKGKSFSWRNCASKVSMKYRYMQSDMYNLVPTIWSINALRSNYSFAEISWEEREFWTCDMEIADRKAEPSDDIKWDVARIYMYMSTVYPGHWIISNKNKPLYEAWNKLDPISDEECKRYKLIKNIQENDNPILEEICQ